MILKIITMKDQNRANKKTPEEGQKPDYAVTNTSWYEAKHIRHTWVKVEDKAGMQHQFEMNGMTLCVDDNVMNAETRRHIYILENGKTIDSY